MDENPKPKKQEKLPEGVYRRPDSETLWISYYVRKRRIRESAETTSIRKAEALLELRKAEHLMGKQRHLANRNRSVSLAELYRDVKDDYTKNNLASIDDLEQRWRIHLEPFFGALAAEDVTTDLLRKYVEQRQSLMKNGKRAISDTTINRTLAIIRRMFNLGMEATPKKVEFCPYVPMMRERNTRTGFLRHDQQMVLRAACAEVGDWLLCAFEIAVTFGWRSGSILKLLVRDVDMMANTLRLEGRTTKNGDPVEVTMPQPIRELIEKLIAKKRAWDPIFTRPDGTRVKDFRGVWAVVTAAAGVPDLLFHDLRRTAAKNLRRAGVSERVVMDIGGWKTASVFHGYGIVDNDDISDAMKKLAEKTQELEERRKAEEAKRRREETDGNVVPFSPTKKN